MICIVNPRTMPLRGKPFIRDFFCNTMVAGGPDFTRSSVSDLPSQWLLEVPVPSWSTCLTLLEKYFEHLQKNSKLVSVLKQIIRQLFVLSILENTLYLFTSFFQGWILLCCILAVTSHGTCFLSTLSYQRGWKPIGEDYRNQFGEYAVGSLLLMWCTWTKSS